MLKKTAIIVVILWIAAQIALIVCFWGHPQRTDMGTYISMAQRCFANGEWYPMAEDVYSDFIWTPGFINYLILQLHIFGTINLNAVINLFLNIAILLEVYYLGSKFFSKRVGLISVIISCLLYSNLFIVLGANTEVPFLFLCLSALCLVFSNNWKYVVPAAVMFALANWIRPLAIIFILSSAVYFAITKTKVYNYIALIIPYISIIFIIGTVTEKKIGYFVYQSTTMGYNLLVSSHDNDANGNFYYFGKPFGENRVDSIENSGSVTFVEKDSIWRARALAWMKEHPDKVAAMFFAKISILYLNDHWSGMSHFSTPIDTASIKRGDASLSSVVIRKILKGVLLSAPYYLALLFFLYALYTNRKDILTVKSVFLLIIILGTGATCIIVALPRYHYTFMFSIIIYAAWGIDTLANRLTVKKSK